MKCFPIGNGIVRRTCILLALASGCAVEDSTVPTPPAAPSNGGNVADGRSGDAGDRASSGADGGTTTGPFEDGASAPPPSACVASACAFPGAEGFGTATPGGRGGRIIHVTTLAASGPGSFREAILATGPRTIVFDVSGVIDMKGAVLYLSAENSYVTVAGQTSPGGITIKDGTLMAYEVDFHDAIFRFLRFRGPNVEDNFALNEAHHFIIDHCDFSGGRDETFDITNGHDYTVQWTTITNSPKGPSSQNYGILMAYSPTTRISFHHNFTAHHANRCAPHMHWVSGPADPDGAIVDLRNNVFYNCAFPAVLYAELPPNNGVKWNLVGNTAIAGPSTDTGMRLLFSIPGTAYFADNRYDTGMIYHPEWYDGAPQSAPFAVPAVATQPVDTARENVLAWVGAWPRDPMNTRTIGEAKTLTGTLGKNDDALITSGPPAPADTDRDGMPDAYEDAHGLNKNDPADALIVTASGYTHVELYLAERAASLIGQ